MDSEDRDADDWAKPSKQPLGYVRVDESFKVVDDEAALIHAGTGAAFEVLFEER